MSEKRASRFGVFSFDGVLVGRQVRDYGRLLWWIVAQPQRVQHHLLQANVDQRQQLMRLGNWCLGVVIWLPLFLATAVLAFSNLAPFTPESALLQLLAFGLAIGLTGWSERVAHALSSNAVVQVGLTAVLAVISLLLCSSESDLPVVGLAFLGLLCSTMTVAVLATFLFWVTRSPLPWVMTAVFMTLTALLFNLMPLHLLFLLLLFCAALLINCLSQQHQLATRL